MAWYSGSIPQAINESKSKEKLFVVYVKGNNDTSGQMDNIWDHEIVQSLCKDKCVALKIIEDSIEHKQFSQFYPVLTIPTVFCIGGNGSLLDSFSTLINEEELSARLNKAIEEFKQISANTAAVAQVPASSSTGSGSIQPDELTEEEKEQKAKELQEKINQIRIQKVKKAEDLDRKKEVERREVGKNLQTLKEKQDEAARRKIIEERKKAKLDEKEAKERVKRLLEQDRLEKKMQRDAEIKEREATQAQEESEIKPESVATSSSNKCRLQFRLPDGSAFNSTLTPTQTLREARIVLCTNRPALNPNSIQLVSSFPRQVFANEDYKKTLQELKLVPSAVVIVTSQHKVAKTTGDDGFFMKVFSMLMLILMFPVNLIKSIFFPTSPTPDSSQQSTDASAGSSYLSTSTQQRSGASRDVRRRGNTSRLTDIRGENDDDPTWNGNSTQQL